jgi:protein-tyrosine phosphatase
MPEFVIHELAVGGGALALSPMPGRTRHYYTDWQRLEAWRPDMVLTMTAQAELDRKGAGTLGVDLRKAGVTWHHLPIFDFGVPDGVVDAAWPDVAAEVLACLARSGRVLVHCYGGCGRSGMAVLRLMIAAGETADLALARLRTVRPCAVETDAQLAWARQM